MFILYEAQIIANKTEKNCLIACDNMCNQTSIVKIKIDVISIDKYKRTVYKTN